VPKKRAFEGLKLPKKWECERQKGCKKISIIEKTMPGMDFRLEGELLVS
jgi:hypothetical protein